MVLGAEKSWSEKTPVDDVFYDRVDHLLYAQENGIQYLKKLSELHDHISWNRFCHSYMNCRYQTQYDGMVFRDKIAVKAACKAFAEELKGQTWRNDEYRQEMLLAAEGLCLVAQMSEKMNGIQTEKLIDTRKWVEKYSEKWLEKNKSSELHRITEMFSWLEEMEIDTCIDVKNVKEQL